MKRIAATVAAGLAAACAPMDGAPGNGDVPPAAGGACDTTKAESLAGRQASEELGVEALARAGARTLRWIRPGDMVTMDFRQDRLNIDLDEQGRVTAFRCG